MTDSASTFLCVLLEVGHSEEPVCPRASGLMRIKDVGLHPKKKQKNNLTVVGLTSEDAWTRSVKHSSWSRSNYRTHDPDLPLERQSGKQTSALVHPGAFVFEMPLGRPKMKCESAEFTGNAWQTQGSCRFAQVVFFDQQRNGIPVGENHCLFWGKNKKFLSADIRMPGLDAADWFA